MLVQHLVPTSTSFSQSLSLYIHRSSQQWKVTRFNHTNPWKELCGQSLRHAVIENGELTIATIALTSNPIAMSLSSNTT